MVLQSTFTPMVSPSSRTQQLISNPFSVADNCRADGVYKTVVFYTMSPDKFKNSSGQIVDLTFSFSMGSASAAAGCFCRAAIMGDNAGGVDSRASDTVLTSSDMGVDTTVRNYEWTFKIPTYKDAITAAVEIKNTAPNTTAMTMTNLYITGSAITYV